MNTFEKSRLGVWPRFGGLAFALAIGCGAGVDRTETQEPVGSSDEALQFTHRVRIQVLTVSPGFTAQMMTDAAAHANTVWAASGIQFDFNPATDVSNPGLPVSVCDNGATLGAVGNAIVGK